MNRFKKVGAVAVGVAVIAVAVPVLNVPAVAGGLARVIVANGPGRPVPVKEPLWQGTPYVHHTVSGDEECTPISRGAIPAGQTLFLERVSGEADVTHVDGGTPVFPTIRFTPLGETNPIDIPIPMQPKTARLAASNAPDRYEGALEIGQPTTVQPEICVRSARSSELTAAAITAFGYLVPAV